MADEGKPGRVLYTLTPEMVSGDTRVYVVSPGKMMEAAAAQLRELGVSVARLLDTRE